MQAIIDFLIARAKEPSTWGGIVVAILGVVGIQATAVQIETLQGYIVGIVGLLAVLIPSRKL